MLYVKERCFLPPAIRHIPSSHTTLERRNGDKVQVERWFEFPELRGEGTTDHVFPFFVSFFFVGSCSAAAALSSPYQKKKRKQVTMTSVPQKISEAQNTLITLLKGWSSHSLVAFILESSVSCGCWLPSWISSVEYDLKRKSWRFLLRGSSRPKARWSKEREALPLHGIARWKVTSLQLFQQFWLVLTSWRLDSISTKKFL